MRITREDVRVMNVMVAGGVILGWLAGGFVQMYLYFF